LGGGGGTHSLGREEVGASQCRRGDTHSGTLGIYVFCALCLFTASCVYFSPCVHCKVGNENFFLFVVCTI
jgi:hypothetical protein